MTSDETSDIAVAIGKITVKTYDPTVYDTVDGGPDLVRVSVTETFHGDIEAAGSVEFLQVMRADGGASFVGLERVVGTLAGRAGSFVLQDNGTVANAKVRGEWFVVPGSGTGELTGLSGEGSFEADLGEGAAIRLSYRFTNGE